MEDMITLYKPTKLQHIRTIKGAFKVGRPYQIIEFRNIISNEIIIFCNIHCGQSSSTCIKSYVKFGQDLHEIINGRDHKSLHIIIAGDNNENYSSNVNIIGIEFNLDTAKEPTCCDIKNGVNLSLGKYDWILYNKSRIQSTVEMNGPYYSDHLPVSGKI